MTTTILRQAAPAARKVLNFAAPALVLGLVLVSQAQGRINYPPPPAGSLERAVDTILIKERADVIQANRLVTQQNQVNARLNTLQQQLAQATNPAVIAALQRQINQTLAQFASLGVAIARNNLQLQNNLNVLNPQKDRALATLLTLPRPQNQIRQFVQAARLQENIYATLMRAFLSRRPISPVFAF